MGNIFILVKEEPQSVICPDKLMGHEGISIVAHIWGFIEMDKRDMWHLSLVAKDPLQVKNDEWFNGNGIGVGGSQKNSPKPCDKYN